MTLTANMQITIESTQIGAGALANPEQRIRKVKRRSWESGTANGKVDIQYSATRTLAASANEDLDLAGVLAEAFGATFTAVEIASLYIEADAANVNNVVFGPASTNGFLGPFGAATHRLTLGPDQFFAMPAPTAGWAVTAGTGDKINIANSGAGSSVTYTIHILARSA